MRTYTKLHGDVVDLTSLNDDQLAYVERCDAARREDVSWAEMLSLVFADNPFLTRGFLTPEVADTAFGESLMDLLDRVGIASGRMLAGDNDDVESDPLADSTVKVADAAEERGVTLRTIYTAIERGDLVGDRNVRPALVSRKSLNGWAPNQDRQRAGKVRQDRSRATAPHSP